jgi:hypothetical protein
VLAALRCGVAVVFAMWMGLALRAFVFVGGSDVFDARSTVMLIGFATIAGLLSGVVVPAPRADPVGHLLSGPGPETPGHAPRTDDQATASTMRAGESEGRSPGRLDVEPIDVRLGELHRGHATSSVRHAIRPFPSSMTLSWPHWQAADLGVLDRDGVLGKRQGNSQPQSVKPRPSPHG